MTRLRGPLADSYLGAVALVVFALTPYLMLSTAMQPLTTIVGANLGMSEQSLELTNGMANAAYAVGTVAAVQLAVHLPARRLLLVYVSLFVIGSVLAAAASAPAVFIAGRVLQGLCTSLMLIAAVPPLVTGWEVSKMPWTAATMNMCIFGATAVGPVVGGIQAGAGGWRALFWVIVALAVLALAFALLTYEDKPPQDRSSPWDWVAQGLAGAGCAATFFGASELTSHSFSDAIVLVPLFAGLALITALVVYEHQIEHPLMPIRALTSTLPVMGIVIAVSAAAASVGLVLLTQTALESSVGPTHAGLLFLPEFGAAVVTAALFGALVRTRLIPVLALAGLLTLCGAAAVLSGVTSGGDAVVLVGSGLVGLGVGASVSPALFIAGFSLRSAQIQRVFALIELLRAVAAFVIAPILLHVAATATSSQSSGIQLSIWICLGIAALGASVGAYVFGIGRARLERPRLEPWLEGEEPALESPPLAAAFRGDVHAGAVGDRG